MFHHRVHEPHCEQFKFSTHNIHFNIIIIIIIIIIIVQTSYVSSTVQFLSGFLK
jgi:hypothetical protein